MRIDIKGTIIPNDYAWIYDWLEMDCTCPKKVQDIIDKANGEQLDVYIDSGGGDVFAGSAIYSSLRSYSGQVKIHIVGLAASSASVIACAGESDISPTAMMMVHNVSTTSSGDYHDMDKSSDTLQRANKAIASAYVTKTGMTEIEALKLMDNETWLPADEAVKLGLVDKIADNQNLRLTASVFNSLSPEVIDKIKNVVKPPIADSKSDFLLAETKLKYLKMKGGI